MAYRGRFAPSPTGYLHIGHAAAFLTAQQRAEDRGGRIILRVEDLDRERCRPEFRVAFVEDMQWFGLRWQDGPFLQSERRNLYLNAWQKLRDSGFIYPCSCSRRDVQYALGASHASGEEEPLYPGTCRARRSGGFTSPAGVNWRFRVPDGEEMAFVDQRAGPQQATAGVDFGDFVVWRKDDIPAYQLAVVVDDAAMRITEVVRGADLRDSTFRQLLLYRALELQPPDFCHVPLVTDERGQRLAKRHDSLSLRALRESGKTPSEVRRMAQIGAAVPG